MLTVANCACFFIVSSSVGKKKVKISLQRVITYDLTAKDPRPPMRREKPPTLNTSCQTAFVGFEKAVHPFSSKTSRSYC